MTCTGSQNKNRGVLLSNWSKQRIKFILKDTTGQKGCGIQGDKEVIIFYILTTCQVDKFAEIQGGSQPYVASFFKTLPKDAPCLTDQNLIIKISFLVICTSSKIKGVFSRLYC